MSTETYAWLRDNVLAGGFVPWWSDGTEPNVTAEPVEFSKVQQLLTSWTPLEERLYTADMVELDGYHAWRASDSREILTVVPDTTALHSYSDWLTDSVSRVLGDEAVISSAGMLKRRTQAWVTIERPEVITVAGGIQASPFVTLSVALDNSLATQANQNTRVVCCDNTVTVARGEGMAFKSRKTSGSGKRLGEYRAVLDALVKGATAFEAEAARLLAEGVDDAEFSRFVDAYVPIADDASKNTRTQRERKRQDITQLYRTDERAAQWRGTAWGVLQAVNTWEQHMSRIVNNTGARQDDRNLRAMRTYDAMVHGRGMSDDVQTVKVLESVLS